jgi:hypothetical protein
MSKKILSASLLVAVALGALCSTGCGVTKYGPHMGILAYPIPISPYLQDNREDAFNEKERYGRVAILGPLTAGGPAVALDPPSDDEIMRALERARPIEGGVPLLWERNRNNVRIVKEKIADYIDPPRVYPLIGPAQLHHAHYKCTIYFSEITRVGWPVPHTTRNEDAQEVIYIDHNHFHMVGNVDTGAGANY